MCSGNDWPQNGNMLPVQSWVGSNGENFEKNIWASEVYRLQVARAATTSAKQERKLE